jgi:uncharacterized OsmC-like protein
MAAMIKDAVATVKEGLGVRTNLIEGIDVTKMNQFHDTIKANPENGKIKYWVTCTAMGDMNVKAEMLRYEIGNETFKHARTFTQYSDRPTQLFGKDNGPTPAEHLLMALGSCLTMAFLQNCAFEKFPVGSVLCKVKGKIDLNRVLTNLEKQQYGTGQLSPGWQSQGTQTQGLGQGQYTEGQYSQGQTWQQQQDAQMGFKAICAKFDIQALDKNQVLDRDKLRLLVQKAENSSVVCQTLKYGTNLCVCLKGESAQFESQYGMRKGVSLYEKGKEPQYYQGSNLPTSNVSKQFEAGKSPDSKEWGTTGTSGTNIPIKSGVTGVDTYQKKGTTF